MVELNSLYLNFKDNNISCLSKLSNKIEKLIKLTFLDLNF